MPVCAEAARSCSSQTTEFWWFRDWGPTSVGSLTQFPSFVITRATFTVNASEPSTASLLLIAFAGLAVLGRRGRLRATLLPTHGAV